MQSIYMRKVRIEVNWESTAGANQNWIVWWNLSHLRRATCSTEEIWQRGKRQTPSTFDLFAFSHFCQIIHKSCAIVFVGAIRWNHGQQWFQSSSRLFHTSNATTTVRVLINTYLILSFKLPFSIMCNLNRKAEEWSVQFTTFSWWFTLVDVRKPRQKLEFRMKQKSFWKLNFCEQVTPTNFPTVIQVSHTRYAMVMLRDWILRFHFVAFFPETSINVCKLKIEF